MSLPGVNFPSLQPFVCVAVSMPLRTACLSPAQQGLPFPLCPLGNVCKAGGAQYLLVALLNNSDLANTKADGGQSMEIRGVLMGNKDIPRAEEVVQWQNS